MQGGDSDITFSLFSGDFGSFSDLESDSDDDGYSHSPSPPPFSPVDESFDMEVESDSEVFNDTSLSAEDGIPQEATYVAVTGRN